MRNAKDRAILNFLTETVWAINPVVLERMVEIVHRHAEGVKLSQEEIQLAIGRDAEEEDGDRYYVEQGTAVIPVHGVIAKHASQVNGVSQPRGTSVEQIEMDLQKALASREVRRIVLHIESPGGTVSGVADLAEKIRLANQEKPVIGYASDQASSAAYWLASQAGELYASRTAWVGNIGTYTVIADTSAAAEKAGVRYAVIKSGQFKGVAVPGVPVRAEDLADIRKNIDRITAVFTADVAAGRGMNLEDLLPIADGRSFTGQEAAEAGLIDGVARWEDVINGDTKQTNARGATTGAAHGPSPTADEPTGQRGDVMMSNEKQTVSAADLQEAKTAAATEERQRVKAVSEVLAGYPELLAKAIEDGDCGQMQAQAMLVPVLQAKVESLQAEAAEQKKKLDLLAKAGNPAVAQESSDAEGTPKEKADAATGKAGDDGKAQTYAAAVESLQKQGKSRAEAFEEAARTLQKSHQAWKESQ